MAAREKRAAVLVHLMKTQRFRAVLLLAGTLPPCAISAANAQKEVQRPTLRTDVARPASAGKPIPAAYVLQAQGDAHFGAGGKAEQEDAVRAYTQAALANPQSVTTRLCLGVSLAALHRSDLAAEQFHRAYLLAPNDLLCALLYQNALAERGSGAEAQEMYLDIAQKFARKNGAGLDAAGSIARLRAGVKSYPKSAILYLLLGDAYQTGEDWKNADAAYQSARRLAPRWAKPCVNLGISRLAQNKPTEAIATFEAALVIEPGSVQAQLWKGNAQLKAGDGEAAVRSFQGVASRALSRDTPAAAQAATGMGQALAQSRKYDKAIISLQDAQKIEPTNPVPPALIGEMHLQNGEYSEAASAYGTAVRLTRSGGLFSNRPVLYRALAEAHLCAHKPADALAALDRALSDEPESSALWHRLKAQAYFDQNQNANAQQELRDALDNAAPSDYPLDTLNAIAARSLIVVMMSDYEADLTGGGVRRTTLPGGAVRLAARARVPGGQAETTHRALHGLASLARYRSDVVGEIHYRSEITKQDGSTGVDLFMLADAYDSRAGRPADARSAYSAAMKKGGLSPALVERAKERLVRLTAPLYKP